LQWIRDEGERFRWVADSPSGSFDCSSIDGDFLAITERSCDGPTVAWRGLTLGCADL
jgi:hypothetical protein